MWHTTRCDRGPHVGRTRWRTLRSFESIGYFQTRHESLWWLSHYPYLCLRIPFSKIYNNDHIHRHNIEASVIGAEFWGTLSYLYRDWQQVLVPIIPALYEAIHACMYVTGPSKKSASWAAASHEMDMSRWPSAMRDFESSNLFMQWVVEMRDEVSLHSLRCIRIHLSSPGRTICDSSLSGCWAFTIPGTRYMYWTHAFLISVTSVESLDNLQIPLTLLNLRGTCAAAGQRQQVMAI